ncbi:transposase, IS4 family [Oesophagostomum dentatum]|uniref:Transposase, IS4 family n=1 Tax=Oesophagostomum dentatum TaxID=61180 RepID=A0A0B1SS85_OESDE|nr:transposase, IS4 family [Oesophagostomum dentatum]
MGSNADEIFDHVLDALLQWSGSAIKWPTELEQKLISQRFSEMTEIKGIIGCLDGTIIGAPNPSDATSEGPHALNVAVVTDDKKQFRWVLAKYKSDLEDDTVFKRSLLCQQLKEGTKKGVLIGDDDYESESFLITPKSKEKETGVAALGLRKAHKIVEEAIASWKWQFPILTSHIKSPKIARIIVGTAAIYNLTRAQGEPLFTADEG